MTADPLVAHLRRTTAELDDRAGVRDHGVALTRIVHAAVAAVPGTHEAGLTPADDRPADLDAPATPVVGKLDALQRELGEGPAVTALADAPADGVVAAGDFAGEDRDRWPEFAEHALEAGYRSLLAVRLEVGGAPRAALNLYATRAAAFDGQARRAAGLFGMHAGMLLLAAEHAAHLERALASRDLIGRAKGVLMERFGLDDDAAFARLVDASQRANLKLVEVAAWLDGQHAADRSPDVEVLVPHSSPAAP
ncbi:GAF and ANTAR domain-containing protein [Actinomycetospora sp. TBRC 11914]|uniref:GAF and ANTAR domain-containing protein n=1 Tax=Actinomycetospora sp. TBRC 11914 TaxID=2729387 RepID=UPI00145F85D1|nr:GAF and ANTAR domain-containing protein [Actinomycetospora sp. TBRC 11914]NMO94090.1 ANTAR domain-containing protein [Actinomycetospora sp. TBRC 11914]